MSLEQNDFIGISHVTIQDVQVQVPGEAKLRPFTGAVSQAAVKAFVTAAIPDKVVSVKNADDLKALLHACGAAEAPQSSRIKGNAKGIPQAKWNLCAVLVTDKGGGVKPLFKSLALQYHGQARSLELDCALLPVLYTRFGGSCSSACMCMHPALPATSPLHAIRPGTSRTLRTVSTAHLMRCRWRSGKSALRLKR